MIREGNTMLGTKIGTAAFLSITLTPHTPGGRGPPSLRPIKKQPNEKLKRVDGNVVEHYRAVYSRKFKTLRL